MAKNFLEKNAVPVGNLELNSIQYDPKTFLSFMNSAIFGDLHNFNRVAQNYIPII